MDSLIISHGMKNNYGIHSGLDSLPFPLRLRKCQSPPTYYESPSSQEGGRKKKRRRGRRRGEKEGEDEEGGREKRREGVSGES